MLGVLGVLLGGGFGRLAAQDGEGHDERDGHEDRADEVGEVVAAVQRGGGGLAVGAQAVGALGGQGRQHGEADRSADLDRGVDQARGQARVCGVAPDIASVISDGKARPAPRPNRTIGGTMSVRKFAVHRRAGEQQEAGRDRDEARRSASS